MTPLMLMNPVQAPAAATATVHPILLNPLMKTRNRSKQNTFQGEVASKEVLDVYFSIARQTRSNTPAFEQTSHLQAVKNRTDLPKMTIRGCVRWQRTPKIHLCKRILSPPQQ